MTMTFTEAQRETIRDLRRALEYAPSRATHALGLVGWRTTDDLFVCARCGARLLARGCTLPRGVVPVWIDETLRPTDRCVTCAVASVLVPVPCPLVDREGTRCGGTMLARVDAHDHVELGACDRCHTVLADRLLDLGFEHGHDSRIVEEAMGEYDACVHLAQRTVARSTLMRSCDSSCVRPNLTRK